MRENGGGRKKDFPTDSRRKCKRNSYHPVDKAQLEGCEVEEV